MGRWMLAQAAVLHRPNDVQIYVLTDASGAGQLGLGAAGCRTAGPDATAATPWR